jgi:hypothetical protein
MAAPTLTLQLSDKTLKKLRALAMLSGSTVDQLEQEFAQYFDQMLTDNIAHLLTQMDGKPPESVIHPEDPSIDLESVENWRIGETHTKVEADPNAHDLSEEALPEETKSLAEQVEDDGIQPTQFKAPDAGGDAEKFLDAAIQSAPPRPPEPPVGNFMGSQTRTAKKTFNPQAPRVKISDYTGEEDGSFI